MIELYDGRVYDIDNIKDLIRHNCKGRPITKQMKGHNEENNNVSTSKAQKENVRNDCENVNNGSKERSDNMMERLSIDNTLLIANTTNVTSLCSIQFNKVIMGVLYQFWSIS
ncbi:hypothetical protein GLOIN_2v1843246 [Rhizophagus clarus]|uniref:Uncharacterized protein n=1 Tax=Rhizophagus clarus TaxID=94130 RepID=A0A8H3MDG5_9GLOM|nr:hypothetical protein GLOIN_2v1843246 [Rhizophagus clarus]